jgi:DNA polymerase III epsilon subunit-like protein
MFSHMNLIGTDTETGGLYPSRHALLSIAGYCSWGRLPFLVYVTPESQPGKVVEAEAAKKNGYTPELWAKRDAKPVEMAMEWYRDWLKACLADRPEAKVVCHHLAFDKPFLEEAAMVAGMMELGPTRYDWRCSLQLLADLMDEGLIEKGSASLERLGTLCGVWPSGKRPEVHEAHEDAEVCVRGYEWLQGVRKRASENDPATVLMMRLPIEARAFGDLAMLAEKHWPGATVKQEGEWAVCREPQKKEAA